MKIEPVKNYRKPGYAMKIASIIAAAGSLAGCSSAQLAGDVAMVTDDAKTTTEELQLDGEVGTECSETTTVTSSKTSQTTVKTTATTTEPMLDGDIAVTDESETTPAQTTAFITSKQTTGTTATTTELELDGVQPIYTETTEVTTAGVPPIYTETTEVTLAGEPVLPME